MHGVCQFNKINQINVLFETSFLTVTAEIDGMCMVCPAGNALSAGGFAYPKVCRGSCTKFRQFGIL
jgi:hypothetical protein